MACESVEDCYFKESTSLVVFSPVSVYSPEVVV